MENNATLIIRKNKKGRLLAEVQIEGLSQPMAVPSFYESLNESFNNKPCVVERAEGLISRIMVDGTELKRRDSKQEISKRAEGRAQRPLPQQRDVHSSTSQATQKTYHQQKPLSLGSILKIPLDTRECVHEMPEMPHNFAIVLNHFIEWDNHKPSKSFLKKVSDIRFSTDLCTGIRGRNEWLLRSIKDRYHTQSVFSAKVNWRMVVGLGAESVHETSMALHHIYGIPYIPGSALKGIARNAAVEELCGGNEEPVVMDALLISLPDISELSEEKKREVIKKTKVQPKNDTIDKILKGWEEFEIARKVFGGQTQAGGVTSMDAFPRGEINIKPDIMNPHYPDYYGKSDPKPPADWQRPNPITFLTVENTTFLFCLVAKEKHKGLLVPAERWLKLALENQGVGAKTSVGYGYFQNFQ